MTTSQKIEELIELFGKSNDPDFRNELLVLITHRDRVEAVAQRANGFIPQGAEALWEEILSQTKV